MQERNFSEQQKEAQNHKNKIKKAYAKPELIDLDDVRATQGKFNNPQESGSFGPS
ncbi:MAG TPA: hypothetical protein VFM46_18905 [Pseudomonadales bacterium]|nr:hypothetical protein [Pseudomonadales bacterium]